MRAKETICLSVCAAAAVMFLGSRPADGGVLPSPQFLGHIAGFVAKDSGAPIDGAQVRLLTDSGKTLRFMKTTKGGQFEFDRLSPGKYWVYTKYGFLDDKQLVIIDVGTIADLKVVLE